MPVYPDGENYPRFVGVDRGSTYEPVGAQKATKPLGYIDQVSHTMAYIDSTYAMQNECHLMFGESTASSALRALDKAADGGTALFCVNELTRVAAQRVCSAREAIKLMGSLAEEHGFYGADGGAGEVLMVGDTEEVFIFHILSDPTKKSAIWVAQRVPDDHAAVIANCFSIREVDLDDSHTFLGSSNMKSIALEYGLWDGKGLLDFSGAFSGGEYASKYYTGRRVWDGYRRFAPSLKLNPEYGSFKLDRPYPVSVKVDEKLSVHDLMAASRSHYEGTEFDMTKGLAAGPFGSPDRYGEGKGHPGYSKPPQGAWERTVGLFRTTGTKIITANSNLPDAAAGTVWWAAGDSSKSVYVPSMVSAGSVPMSLSLGNEAELDRGSAFWAHRYIANLVQLRYNLMIRDVNANAKHWEDRATDVVQTEIYQVRSA